MAHDRDRYDRDRYDRDRFERDRDRDRGTFERAGDEVRSWFGDDDARRRRERDERERYAERGYGERSFGERNFTADRPFQEREFGRPEREEGWNREPARPEAFRDYRGRYGQSYSPGIERDRTAAAAPLAGPIGSGSQGFGPEGFGAPHYDAREWRSSETWRVPGPFTGRGPKGYQRSDERIREDLSDRLTAHGRVDASDIEVRIQGGEVTLMGFVDSRDAKRLAEDIAEDVPGVREVHNQLRVRTHADDTGVGRTSVLGLTERETQNADTARQADAAARSRARNP